VELSDFFRPLLLSLSRYLLILLVSYVLAWGTMPVLMKMIMNAGFHKLNYQGEQIPVFGGLVFISLLPFITGIGLLVGAASYTNVKVFLFLTVIFGMGFMGFLDDQLGNHAVKGFRGHLTALIKNKELTTGGFKLLFGAVIAMVFSIGSAELVQGAWFIWPLLLNFFLITLSANTINLFDLRPGRAGKIYILGFIVILIFSKQFEDSLGLFLPILAIMLVYLPYDLHAKVMMGDLGSNMLGASLGMMMAWMFSDLGKIIAVAFMIIIQLAAEKYSFTEIIERYRWLKTLDQLGRRKEN
jgi:UDP-GlcNAc:undecaprenyl-phosphate GlcNAc-1-phosphate transferase